MELVRYTELEEFCSDVMPLLTPREVENNLPIGVLNRGLQGEPRGDWFMARIGEGLVLLMTPPHNLMLVTPDGTYTDEALRTLLHYVIENDIELPGVIGEKDASNAFAEMYAERMGLTAKLDANERVYRLDAVEDVPIIGTLRLAEEKDMHYLPYWLKGFMDECFHRTDSPIDSERVRKQIERKVLYVLDVDGQPVSFAGTSRQMPHGRSVGPVYTPPYYRGHGYATACVALLSRIILGMGNEYCVLFTDLANPTSNSIYQTIGYRPLGDYAEILFA